MFLGKTHKYLPTDDLEDLRQGNARLLLNSYQAVNEARQTSCCSLKDNNKLTCTAEDFGAGKVRILFIFEPPAVAGIDPKTAWLGDMEKNVVEKDIDISHCLAVHKNTPNEIKQVLKGTLEKVVKEPEFLADLKKMELMPNYLDGNTIMQKKLPQRLEQIKVFYKERGWIK